MMRAPRALASRRWGMETVYYHLSDYISHRRAGLGNLRALALAGVPLAETAEEASTVILHDDPLNYPRLFAALPCLRDKRNIAYSVWETEALPEQYLEPLGLVDAIWTCSAFSQAAYAAHFPDVAVVPHVVEPLSVHETDLDTIRQRIGYRSDAFYFYTVTDSINPRKNLFGLLEVFLKNFLHDPDVYLVVKQYRRAYDLGGLRNVISLTDNLTVGEMGALHTLCHCCVSLHHAEAWGLSLSEALSLGNPVIATGYSGNMHSSLARAAWPTGCVRPAAGDLGNCRTRLAPYVRPGNPDRPERSQRTARSCPRVPRWNAAHGVVFCLPKGLCMSAAHLGFPTETVVVFVVMAVGAMFIDLFMLCLYHNW